MTKKIFQFLCVLLFTAELTSAQFKPIPLDYVVMLTAKVQTSPPSITIRWTPAANARSYQVYRKTKTASDWGTQIANLQKTVTSYTDNNVVADSGYEYRVIRATDSTTGYGYIYSAINLHATDYRGRLILIVDSTFTDSLSTEIVQLMKDISADGWSVVRHDVSRNTMPPIVKSIIVNEYKADTLNTKAVLLLGHVPVPYSGNFNPDGHAEHLGAWPADVYYGDMDGIYTDVTVNDTMASNAANKNKPGDGKFDQIFIPSPIELQVSRIDLSNMPTFPKTEKELLRQYLNRDHDYKFKNFTTVPRGLIADNFGTYGEGFASSAWRNFAPMFTDTGIHTGDYLSTLQAKNYLWSYGCGGGDPTDCGGVGSTSNFVNDSIKTVFTMLFGSWFGDWNFQNDFMRAPLASPGLALTSCWSGRPYWFFQHMVLGENIGYSTRLTQNNYSTYSTSFGGFVHIALMGDLTLRQHVIAPPTAVSYTYPTGGFGISINWTPSPENVDGYYVYRSTSEFGEYDRISADIITAGTYIDQPIASGLYYYYVKAVKWENTPSGIYLNTSEGAGDSVTVLFSGVADRNKEADNVTLFPNPVNNKLSVVGYSSSAGNIEIQNLLGETIINQSIPHSSGRTDINVKNLAAGTYMMVLKNTDETVVRKFVKLK